MRPLALHHLWIDPHGSTCGVRAGQRLKMTGREARQAYTLRPFSNVYLDPPGRHLLPCIPQIPEPTRVPKLIPQPSRKALNCGVLRRLAGLDANQPDPPLHFQARKRGLVRSGPVVQIAPQSAHGFYPTASYHNRVAINFAGDPCTFAGNVVHPAAQVAVQLVDLVADN